MDAKGVRIKWPKRIENEDLNYVWWYIQYFTLDRCSSCCSAAVWRQRKGFSDHGDFGKGSNFKTGLKGQEEEADAEAIEETPK